jgi:O-antigen ligase
MTDRDAFTRRLVTDAQLLALVWLGWQLLLSERDLRATVAGFVAGCLAIVALTWRSFLTGTALHEGTRYAATSFDANDMSVTLALGIPMAAWLALGSGRWRDRLGLLYLPIVAGAIGLSGSRAGALTGSVVTIAVLWWTARRSPSQFALASALVLVGMAIAAAIIPSDNWARILTLREQIASGTMGDRTQIWRAGLAILAQHPVLGVGVGGFRHAVVPALNMQMVAHSTLLSVAVELGLIGFSLFAATLVAVWRGVERCSLRQRAFGRLLLLAWIVGSASLTWESRKATWLVLLIGAVLPVSSPKED